ncbi:hypothetical protein SAMN05216302_101454 [Nitrosomonas aestuarii]|uniref:Uncharacterized protein n=1 Tax=Nitrosomonas aestuarii TaxID=52441 RepID=A0A1I4C4C2_9PROT|nr:hypothetical protein [Nitrosomonas aestuarii]SFK74971.1 hypothetical protein SAMN05216302_101454 [Nitrosomonas aestuarii]
MSFFSVMMSAFFAPLAFILGFFFLYTLSPLLDPFVAACERLRALIESYIDKHCGLWGSGHDDKH